MGAKEQDIPCVLVDEHAGELFIEFGSSCKTSDFIVATLDAWWHHLTPDAQRTLPLIQIKVDNGPESSGCRTQLLKRMVEWVDQIGIPVQLLYYPPYHSQYNPIERCWGILEQHWNGAQRTETQTLLAWAASMTWKGLHPIIDRSPKSYPKGIALTKKQMRPIENRLERSPLLPKWDILVHPT